MSHSTRPHPTMPLLGTLLALLQAYRATVRQERVFVRLAALSLAPLVSLGRHTISQMLVGLGLGQRDWSAWYRLFNRRRIDPEALQAMLLTQVVDVIPVEAPALVVAVDATQVPRSTQTMPGSGYTVSPRSPKWQRGLHFAQRFVAISLLVPRSAAGDSRALPLKSLLLRSAKTTPMGDEPERSESQGALALITWLRERWDALGRAHQPLVVLGDGAYSNAVVLKGLPARVVLMARCAKNRALFALPTYRPAGRGRQPRYGERGPTPQATLHAPDGWRDYHVMVRGRSITVRATITGPWLIKPAYLCPVMLVVVKGVDRGRGTTRRQRDPQFFLLSVDLTSEDEWQLVLPLTDVLAWAWQRWEVEVMHRELKSGFGFGEQQSFSAAGAATVLPWLLWVYALLVLAGYRMWGLAPAPGTPLSRWHRPRRWSFAQLWQRYRSELWQLGDFQPVWTRSPDTWTEITAWLASQSNATLGYRRL